MARVFNFNPGPGALPLSALEQAQRELLDFEGTGMSILEHSHRGKAYMAMHEETKALLRELLTIPDDYDILFMHGGARAQFAFVPMNLLPPGHSADYVITGVWSEKALEEARILGRARVAATTREDSGLYTRVPTQAELELDPAAAYVHLTTNNTVFGTQFHTIPTTGDVPLVADASSDILSRPLDVSRFGLIYAGAQKNMGPAGITVVIARSDLIDRSRTDGVPDIFRYQSVKKGDSLHNTIAVFAVYMVRNVLRWLRASGGVHAMEEQNRRKADLLYGMIDARPDFYRAPVEKASRSWMNAVFRLPTEELEQRFLAETTAAGMVGLKGHRTAGGIRVSMYNAMPVAGIELLVEVMEAFAKKHA